MAKAVGKPPADHQAEKAARRLAPPISRPAVALSAEIEAVMRAIDGVLEVAVFAVADDRFGEAACACIHAGAPIEPGEVFAYCTSRLAGFKLPRYVVPLATPLPRLANEKIDRRQLKTDFADVAKRLPRLSSR